MKLKKDNLIVDDVVFKRTKGFTLRQSDLETLLQGSESEGAFLHNLKADAYLESQNLRMAIVHNRKALRLCDGDLGTYNLCLATFDLIANSLVTLARLEPESLEVGWVYENLKDFSCLATEHHFLALRHYQVVGETMKAVRLESRLRTLYPNHPFVQESDKHEVKSHPSHRKVKDEENRNQKKNTAA